MSTHLSGQEVLSAIDQAVKKEFDANRRVLAFDEYLMLVAEQPERHVRGSARYLADLMDHFGTEPVTSGAPAPGEAPLQRFKLFDVPIEGIAPRVVGHEAVQNQVHRVLRAFARGGVNNKLVLLHGPNGSAKSSIIHALMGGMERYSHEPQGAIYSFNWVFPVDRYTKGGIGLQGEAAQGYGAGGPKGATSSFAKLPDEQLAARIPCEMKDHPLLAVPVEHRRAFVEKLVGKERCDAIWEIAPGYLTQGDLCHRCRQIYDALLVAAGGDFRKVLQHIQVERFYFSRRYRNGLVTIEPQLHVDAQYQQLSYNRSVGSLPASLQGLNLFSLSGDLIDGNRGLIEFSDLLKRPIDSFKYLLSACETGSVNIGNSIAFLDAVLVGSANEVQLDAFKEFPDFTSFKARIELIRVPYLLSASQEREIYVSQLPQFGGEKHVAPHVAWTAALWAVLTRLKKPNSINYPPNVSTIVSNLTPIEKARLYDTGEVPNALSPEERKLLRANVRKLREEYLNIPYYEGRMGASAREVKSLLFDAAHNVEFPCLSPLALLRELEDFVKRVTEYDFLKQDVKDGFHDAGEFINVVRNEYLARVDREVRDSLGLYDSAQWEEFLKKYVQHISLVLKKEKIKNPMTGRLEDPDYTLVDEFERIVEAPGHAGVPPAAAKEGPKEGPKDTAAALEAFRQNIISQVGVWALDHKGEPVVYAKVFPDYWRKLEKHYFESQKATLTKMSDALLVYGTEADDPTSDAARLARQTVGNMKSRYGYCDQCAREVVTFLLRQRY